jgi:hypothetical protein
MEEWRGAVVSIDGVAVGKLEYLRTHGSWFEKLLKGSGDSPMFHVVTLNVPFDPQRTPVGAHVVSVAKPGGPTLKCELTYPDPRGVDVASLAISANKLEDVTVGVTRP